MSIKSSPKSSSASTHYKLTRANGAIADEQTVPQSHKWTDTVEYGENIPGWRQKLRDGISATTSLTGTHSVVRVQPGLLKWKVVNPPLPTSISEGVMDGVCGHSVAPPAGNPSNISDAKANAEALGKFAQRILQARTALQGGVVVGELMQTLQMLKNPAQGLRRLVDDWGYAARRIRSTRRVTSLPFHTRTVAQNLADAWLEYSFGWKPLLHDIRDGCRALNTQYAGRPLHVRRITGKATTNGEGYDDNSTINQNSLMIWRGRVRSVGSCTVIYRGAVRVEAVDPHEMDPALFGFTPSQFLPTAWELIPYSFLIDYFTNIGDIVAGWSTLFANLAWCNRTVRKSYEEIRTADTDKTLSSAFLSCSPAIVTTSKTSVVRAKYSGTTVPDLTFTIPSLESKKWLNIAALIASRKSDRSWHYD